MRRVLKDKGQKVKEVDYEPLTLKELEQVVGGQWYKDFMNAVTGTTLVAAVDPLRTVMSHT